ncbi:MAG: response regulator [Bacteroidota bacterium]
MPATLYTLRTCTINLIDDDPVYQLILSRLLQNCEGRCRMRYYSTGPEAIAQLSRQADDPASSPDVILLDLNLPMMNGWEVLNEIERIPFANRPKVYILSSSIDPSDKAKAKKHPAISGFLAKPLYLEDVQSLLKAAA